MSKASFSWIVAGIFTLSLAGCAHNAPKVDCDGPLRPINAVPEQRLPDNSKAKWDTSSPLSGDTAADEAAHGR